MARVKEPPFIEVHTRLNVVFLLQSATIHQRSALHFQDRSNLQCSMIAAVAVASLSQLTANLITRKFLDDIIMQGDQLYRNVVAALGFGSVWLPPEKIPHELDVLTNIVGFKFEELGSGGLVMGCGKEIESAIKRGTSVLRRCGIPNAFLFTSQSKTMGFVPIGLQRFLLFNSHCVDRDNRVKMTVAGGAARLFRCVSPAAVCECLLQGHIRNGACWRVICVQLQYQQRAIIHELGQKLGTASKQ